MGINTLFIFLFLFIWHLVFFFFLHMFTQEGGERFKLVTSISLNVVSVD
jgi:hypothetical protein